MNLEQFLNALKNLISLAEMAVEKAGKDRTTRGDYTNQLLLSMEKIVPDWLVLIEQTGLGNKEDLEQVVSDIEYAITNDDIVVYMDVLLNGLIELINQYYTAISEALSDE